MMEGAITVGESLGSCEGDGGGHDSSRTCSGEGEAAFSGAVVTDGELRESCDEDGRVDGLFRTRSGEDDEATFSGLLGQFLRSWGSRG